jgi:hypothetical protein
MVVASNSKEEAVLVNPNDNCTWDLKRKCWLFKFFDPNIEPEPYEYHRWTTNLDSLTVTDIGITYSYDQGDVVIASFNAG